MSKLLNKNNKRKYGKIIILMSVTLIFTFSIVQLKTENGQIIGVNSSSFKDKKIGWGIKRNDNHEQPDVGSANRKILEENGGICIGDDSNKVIYLTFDEGYEAGYTERILNILKDNDVKATFFITSHYLNTVSELVERMIREGHCVGNHTPSSLMSYV